ncbi:hypothetical protein TNCV_3066041 [Trichonephila clavipes]|uniref:Uncharacterized protein n=1 Tax=Trichonephila clavipes TaxID=2585209 RepID=A0A8X6RRI2_TRICX|nr:hypothetical protein TNCV_3066041 [Trichonephila clavipes]
MGFKSGEYAGQSIRVISSLSSSSSTARVLCDRALSSIKMKSGPMAPRNRRTWGEVPPHNSDPRLQTLYRKYGAQFSRSA